MNSRVPFVSITLAGLAIVAFVSPDAAGWALYNRSAIAGGEWWRLFSAHFVHFDFNHLLLNLSGLLLAGGLVEWHSRSLMFSLTALMIMFIGPAMFLAHPDMSFYAGMSGMVYGYAFSAALTHRGSRDPLGTVSKLILVCLPIKILVDVVSYTISVSKHLPSDVVTMPTSHAAGVALALILHCMARLPARRKASLFD